MSLVTQPSPAYMAVLYRRIDVLRDAAVGAIYAIDLFCIMDDLSNNNDVFNTYAKDLTNVICTMRLTEEHIELLERIPR